jgi:hypothetical protein
MRQFSAEEAAWIDSMISRFYFELLSEVDRRAQARSAEDITDVCDLALGLWLIAGVSVHSDDPDFANAGRRLRTFISPKDVTDMIVMFGDHVESDHSEYLPLFCEAIHAPHIQAIGDQLQAFARDAGIEFDMVKDLDRS